MKHSPALAAFLLILAACGGADAERPVRGGGTGAPATTLPAIPGDAPLVAFLGDSISAGLHLSADEAFPAVLQRELAADGSPFRLVNAGVSGDTTAGGVSRIGWILSQHPDVVVVELGGNDGLRGVALEAIEDNLREILERVRAAGARPLLLGMRIPTNYSTYAEEFAAIYPRVAEETGTPLVPFLMEELVETPGSFLPDGIHPTARGHRALARKVGPALEEVLATVASPGADGGGSG